MFSIFLHCLFDESWIFLQKSLLIELVGIVNLLWFPNEKWVFLFSIPLRLRLLLASLLTWLSWALKIDVEIDW